MCADLDVYKAFNVDCNESEMEAEARLQQILTPLQDVGMISPEMLIFQVKGLTEEMVEAQESLGPDSESTFDVLAMLESVGCS